MRRGGLCMFAVVLALAGAGAVRGDVWEQVHVRVVTIHYTTHNGLHRAAYVVLPDWYGPGNNPPIPLIISPHGRGVSAEENVDRWGDLPSIGSFAVVNPEGQGRRFARFSWGYAGQIDDLARMPRILRATIPWLRIEPRRVYAFGTSMGGQETLLLVARHPKLLAGAAAFDPVTNMASRYRDFSRLRCNRGCLRRWGDPIGFGLRALAREEIGGTPESLPRAYARRSPITYARAIARSGVPLQLWWSKRDHVVRSQDQSAALARKLRRLNPAAPLHTFVGAWPHSADMRPYFMLIPALKKFDLVPTRAPSSVRSTQSRPVHPMLPWHHAVRDGNGKLLPWYRPNAGLGYDRVLRLGWNFIERGVPRDPRTRSKVYLNYAVFDGQTLRGSTGSTTRRFSTLRSSTRWSPGIRIRPTGGRSAWCARCSTTSSHTELRRRAGRGRGSRSPRPARVSERTGVASPGSPGGSTAASKPTRWDCSASDTCSSTS